jgi:phosphoribosylanthranilate isomerase
VTRVKICGIRSVEDALGACAAGADALGFVFYAPSPRAVDPEEAQRIISALPPLVSTVGLFVDPDAAQVRDVLSRCALDLLQFHGDEDASFCESFERPYLRAVSMSPGRDVSALVEQHPRARAFLFDAWRADAPGGTGETFAWERIPAMDRPWLLAGGLNPDNVGPAIQKVAPPAVDVSGGVERSRGQKDPQLMRAFVDAVRLADSARKTASRVRAVER